VAPYRIGIDLGGSKTEGILLAPDTSVVARLRRPTPRGGPDPYQAILENTAALIRHLAAEVPGNQRHTVGVGIPGISDPASGRVLNANTTSLMGQPFRDNLRALIEHDLAIENDANCFTAAESRMGAARGHAVVLGLILGTGVGGGLTLNGRVHHGRHGIAGEWGHLSVVPDGRPCWCGNRGCVETLISGTALSQIWQARHGAPRRAEDIVDGHHRGDAACRAVFEQFLEDFGRCLGGLISILDPDTVVIGGGLSHIAELYTEGAARAYRYAFHPDPRTPILKNALGDSAGVFGAAWIGV